MHDYIKKTYKTEKSCDVCLFIMPTPDRLIKLQSLTYVRSGYDPGKRKFSGLRLQVP